MNYTITRRHKGDGLVRDDIDWKNALNVCMSGEDSGEHLGASFYPYGTMIYWGSPQHNQLEFHAKRGGYSAVFTLVAHDKVNEVQVREYGDDNCISFMFPDRSIGTPSITTELPVSKLSINPKGDLDLNPTGRLCVKGEEIEHLIRRIISEV